MTPSSRTRQARRFILLTLGASALLLAGCQTGNRGGREPPRPDYVPPIIDNVPDEARNRVALLVPLSGDDGMVGQSIANAANLALLDSGDKTLRLTIYDTASGGAVAATNKALAEGSRLILGPLLAEDVRAAAPVARRARVPVIAFSNDAAVAGDGVYILGMVPDQSIDRVVRHARGAGASRFAALVPSGLYGQRAAQAMLGAVQRSGGRMTSLQTFNRSIPAVRTAVRALNAKGGYDAC